MKIIFNDAAEIAVQQVVTGDGCLKILALGSPAALRECFSDPLKTRRLIVQERGQTIATYEGYTQLRSIAWAPGNIYTVTMYQQETLPEVQAEVQAAAVLVAQMQAQGLTDEQALQCRAIYPAWSPDNVQYAEDYKVMHEDILYKCISAHTSQENWAPGTAPSLWTAIETGEHAGTQEDPIPVPETVTTAGMEYEKGRYYREGGKTYLMDRQGMDEGEKITLYFPPSALIGQYFSLAE